MELADPSEENEHSVCTSEYKRIISQFTVDHLSALCISAFTWTECKVYISYLKAEAEHHPDMGSYNCHLDICAIQI